MSVPSPDMARGRRARRRGLRGRGLALLALAAALAACSGATGTASRVAPAAQEAPAERAAQLAALREVVGELPAVRLEIAGTTSSGGSLDLLVAATPAAQQRGLQGVTELPDGVGMLFVFATPPGPQGRPGFWMRDTLLALDIAFLVGGVAAGEARVIGVATMTPCVQLPCPITHPGVDYDAALEVGAGGLERAGIRPGSLLRWSDPALEGQR